MPRAQAEGIENRFVQLPLFIAFWQLEVDAVFVRVDLAAHAAYAAVQVGAHQRLNGVQVFLPQNTQHLGVLADNAEHVACAHDVQTDKAGVICLRAGHLLPKVFLAGLAEPVRVHGKVAAEEVVEIKIFRVTAPRSGLQQHIIKVLHSKDLHGRAALHKIPEHHALHRNTLEDELIHHADVDGGNDGALAGDDLHKAVLLQPLQNAADTL